MNNLLLKTLFFFVLAQGLAFAQAPTSNSIPTSKIAGTLVEKGTRKPLGQVNIFVLPHKLKTMTSKKGDFVLEEVPQGEIELVINLSGYQRLQIKRELKDQPLSLKLYLERLDYSDYQTTVVGKREKRDNSGGVLSQEDFLFAPGARGDPVLALENKPGIQTYDFQNGVIIQGADPEDTRYTINGHEVPLLFHFLANTAVVVPEIIDQVEYLAAGFGPEYGRSIGGNVGLFTRNPRDDRFHATGFVDLLNAGALIEGPISKDHSFWIGGRYSYLGFVFDLVANNDSNVTLREAPAYYDLEGNYTWKISSRSTFDLTGVAASDTLKLFIRDFDDPFFRGDVSARTKFFRIIPRLRHRFADGSKLQASAAFGTDDIDFAVGSQFVDAKQRRLTFRSEFEKRFNEQHKVFWGIDTLWSHDRLNVDFPSAFFGEIFTNRETPLSVSDTINTTVSQDDVDVGAYFRNQIRLSEDSRWLFQPNLRFNYFTLTDNFHISPRGEISYRLTDVWTLKAASGFYFQPPDALEIAPEVGNPELDDERAIHYTVGARADFRRNRRYGLKTEFDVFYKDLDNLVIPSTNVEITNGVIRPERFNNQGSGNIIGSQVSVSYLDPKWSVTVAYTFTRSRKEEPGEGEFPSLFDRPHDFNIIASYKVGKWTFSSRFRLISGNPFSPIERAIYDLDNDVFRPVQGPELSRRLPLFAQLDLRADRKWIFKKWILTLYVDIQNVTNRQNVNQIEYSFDYADELDETGIPILPTFGVKGEF